MNQQSNKYKEYLMNASTKGISRHNLETMIVQLQDEVSHNYTLIKSLLIKVQDLENTVIHLTAHHKESEIRPVEYLVSNAT